jgi:hypothetical protein
MLILIPHQRTFAWLARTPPLKRCAATPHDPSGARSPAATEPQPRADPSPDWLGGRAVGPARLSRTEGRTGRVMMVSSKES